MKPLHLLCAGLALLLAFGACSRSRSYPDYSVSSGFTLDSLDACNPQVVENLEVLCRVWGYAKYHHPVFADSTVNIDYELFDLLPKVAKADPETRNRVLADWIRELGVFGQNKAKYDSLSASPDIVTLSDPAWTYDTVRLGAELSGVLQNLRYAVRESNRYARFFPGVGNLDMSNESQEGLFDDCGYRLLYLFRFWNAIEYFSPDRNLTDRDWSEVPAAFIPPFIRRETRVIARLHRELCDSHGAGMIVNMFGWGILPVDVNYADNRVFVTWGEHLQQGDEILSVDGRDWNRVYGTLERYESVSNDENRMRLAADCLCRSQKDTVEVCLLRRGMRLTERVPTIPCYTWYQACKEKLSDTSNLRIFPGSVGYMTGLNYTLADAEQIMHRFRGTKALIVDMRCYPREFMIFNFVGRYFLPRTVHHTLWWYPVPGMPGAFYQTPGTLWVDAARPSVEENPDYYKGRVIVLVDSSTQSQAEYTVMAFQATPRCTVVGTQTAGADGNISQLVMPASTQKSYFSGLGVLYPDGTNTQRIGVRIDVPVHATVEGLKAGRDEILEKALEIIRTGAYDPEAER